MYTITFNNVISNRITYIQVPQIKPVMPIQAPNWTDFLICPICTKEFAENRLPISLGCSHTICKTCLGTLHRTQCPFDQTNITIDINTLPINNALLQLVSSSPKIDYEVNPQIIKSLTPVELEHYKTATKCIEDLAILVKPNGSISSILSRPMQRKLVTLISCQLFDNEGRTRCLRAVRSLGERVVTELILQHQNPQQLSQNLWAAVRARGCQFLGPAMQEEVLKLVLLALEDGDPLSRKILVLYVVSKLKTTFPQASKTSIGHVVQLLYRASCFIVSKRESESSLMTLKEEFRTYEALRREHDTQIVQIATEAGLRIAPDQWSALLYGDNTHKSHMQSIIDKQQNPSSFALSINELVMALQRTGDPANLATLRPNMDELASIDASVDSNVVPTWEACSNALKAVKSVVRGLIDFIQNHGNRKVPETSHLTHTSRYKVSFCREFKTRGHCARGNNCNFAHSEQELERYRTKYKKTARVDATASHNNNNNNGNNPMRDLTNYVVSNGPNVKVNHMNNHHSFSKNQSNSNGVGSSSQQHQQSQKFHKPASYRSENSLYNSPMTPHHLKPTGVYSNASSSTSTPNLSVQLSPNLQKTNSNSPRFAFNGHGVNNNNYSNNTEQSKGMNLVNSGKFMGYNNRPPLSAPPVPQQYNNYAKSPDFVKKQQQLSPYGNVPMGSPSNQQKPHRNIPPPLGINHYHNSNNSAPYFPIMQSTTSNNAPYFTYNSPRHNNGIDEFSSPSWKHQKSPINFLPKNQTSHHISKSSNTSPNFGYNNNVDNSLAADYKRNTSSNRQPMQMNISPSAMMYQQQMQSTPNTSLSNDDIDGCMWKYQQSSPGTKPSAYTFSTVTTANSNMSKDKFIRSDSILTSNTDDSYDNLSNPNGRYGAIGLKNTETSEWSGLQQTINRYDDSFDIGTGETFKPSITMSSVETLSSGAGGSIDLNISAQNSLNGNFLNMQIGNSSNQSASTNKSANLWSSDSVTNEWIDQTSDFDSFGNDKIAKNLWDFLDD